MVAVFPTTSGVRSLIFIFRSTASPGSLQWPFASFREFTSTFRLIQLLITWEMREDRQSVAEIIDSATIINIQKRNWVRNSAAFQGERGPFHRALLKTNRELT